jgi:hypothetical protein
MTTKKSKIDDDMKAEIVKIVQSEIKAIMENQTVPKSLIELPPQPKEKEPGEHGRKVAPGGRKKIASTLDEELERLFREWLKERGLTLSRGLDVVFWHFFGKPPMSFETPKGTDKESDARSVLHAVPPNTDRDD